MKDNHEQSNKDNVKESVSVACRLRAAVLGLTPATIFKITLLTSVLIVLAAGTVYYTASDTKHVNLDKVETSSVVLSGSDNLDGISAGGYAAVEYVVTNQSTSPAYVFIRIEESTAGLYEMVDIENWCEVESAEGDNELIFAYGELGAMTPVPIGDSVTMGGRLHCLADAITYAGLSGDDMDINVTGCLVHGTAENGSAEEHSTSAERLWQAYQDNR